MSFFADSEIIRACRSCQCVLQPHRGGSHTCLTTIPPRLCAKKIIGRRSSCRTTVKSNTSQADSAPLTSGPLRTPSMSVINDAPWSFTVKWETPGDRLIVSASYPNVKIRAFGIFCGNRSLSHMTLVCLSVHAFSLWPLRPWTATMLHAGIRGI